MLNLLGLVDVLLTDDEYSYLKDKCSYLDHGSYLTFLKAFRFRPSEHVDIRFEETSESDDYGDVRLDVHGLWCDTILYEVPLLSLTSEAYFKFCDRDWSHDGQRESAYHKGVELLENGCVFSEFGTRRRRDYHTQDLVMQGLVGASNDKRSCSGKLSGTSNVHFAMKHDVMPIGTVAHEWFMGIAAATDDYEKATGKALQYWTECFGKGVLSIALTDTFGTSAFLKAFSEPLPEDHGPASGNRAGGRAGSFAEIFTGVRQDSGDPEAFVQTMREFYDSVGIEEKTIVFSDSLNVNRCVKYRKLSEENGFIASFGIGTFLTSKLRTINPCLDSPRTNTSIDDFNHLKAKGKSKPLNIVIKLSSANGQPAIKLSDDMGKNTGNGATVQHIKEKLGYVNNSWKEGNESNRW